MKKKLPRKNAASFVISAVLFVLSAGVLLGSNVVAVTVFAEGISENDSVTGNGEISAPMQECICTERCGKYEYYRDCPVCIVDYAKCAYKEPDVKITITPPSGWYMSGSSVKVKFSVEDILNTGNLAVKSVKAKAGQNGSYEDVSEDMYLEISENCSVYVLVTDAHDRNYERSRSIRCFDTVKPTLNAAVSDGLLSIRALDHESGVKAVYVNGYEFADTAEGTLNIRLSQFDAGYEYFTISAMDSAGNMSEVYRTKNPYYKDPKSEDDSNSAGQLPVNAQATKPSGASAAVTNRTTTDADGNITKSTSAEAKKGAESSGTDAENEDGGNTNLGKDFYTIEAASGKVFYLIIDRGGDAEKAYFLTEITERDLLNVTTDNSETLPKNSAALASQIPTEEGAVPDNNADLKDTHKAVEPAEAPKDKAEDAPEEKEEDEPAEPVADESKEDVKSNPLAGYMLMGLLGAAVIGAAYYFKVAKKNQDGEFVEDEDEDDEDDGYVSEEPERESDFFDDDDIAETGPADSGMAGNVLEDDSGGE